MLYKNVASQKIAVFAYTASTGAAKTGDAAQITAYISKDFAAGAATNDVNPTEMDATNMPGWYVFDLTQAETNAEVIVLAPKSSTSGVVLDQVQVFTQDAAISSRASQTSVDDVPTVVEFEARTLVAADYVVVSDLPSVPTASDNATAAAAAILAAADSDPISANVTYSAGVALAGRLAEYADVNPLALEATAQAILASVNTIDDFLDTEIAAILADTNELQTDLVNGGRLDLLIDAIKAKTDVIPASPAAVGSEMLLTAAYDAAKTAATQASVDDLPTNAELATALGTADDATLAAIAALNNLSSAQAQAAAMAALEAYDPPTNAEMVARTLLAASYFDPATDTVARVTLVDTTTTNTDMVAAAPSAATVADAVWDEALSGHAGAGSTGAALSAAGAAGDPWSTALPGAYGAGTAGALLSGIDSNVDMLLAADTSSSDATTAGAISRKRGNSWSIPLTIGAITGYTSLWFTIKSSHDDADASALLQIKLNASTLLDGLLYVNGTTASSDALGSITVNNATTGAIVIAVDETITDDLAPGEYYYDVQTLIAGDVATPDSGTFTVTADVTRSVT